MYCSVMLQLMREKRMRGERERDWLGCSVASRFVTGGCNVTSHCAIETLHDDHVMWWITLCDGPRYMHSTLFSNHVVWRSHYVISCLCNNVMKLSCYVTITLCDLRSCTYVAARDSATHLYSSEICCSSPLLRYLHSHLHSSEISCSSPLLRYLHSHLHSS